jgi:hypothetical protein
MIVYEKKLTTKARDELPASDFALPKEKKYPIDTIERGRNALARVAATGSDAEKRAVRAAVHKKFPDIEIGEDADAGMGAVSV